MILKKNFDLNFKKFGILISLNERLENIHQYLKSNYSDNIYYRGDFKEAGFNREDLLLAHTKTYVDDLYNNSLEKIMRDCFELDEYGDQYAVSNLVGLRDLILKEAFFSYQGMKLALAHGFCFFLGGGMHHAMSFAGRGFCLVNDIVIGARKLMKQNLIKKVWVIDIDAHKGDGTSELTYQDSNFLTLSIHMKNGWPLSGRSDGDPELIESSVDIEIDFGEESSYLPKLEHGLAMLKSKSEILPELAIVVDGADPYEYDELPGSVGIRLDKQQMFLRDQMVYQFLLKEHIPTLFVMGGGYGKKVGEVYIQFIDWLLKQRACE